MLKQLYDFLSALWLTIVPEGTLRLPDNVFSVISLAMRYWFLLLMILIVWLCYRWYRAGRREQKRKEKSLPNYQYIGEMVVLKGNEQLPPNTVISVPWEGTIGSVRTDDIVLPSSKIHPEHLWFRFDESQGLFVFSNGHWPASIENKPIQKNKPELMIYGSILRLGPYELCLRLFAGFAKSLYPQPSAPKTQPPPVVLVPVYYTPPVMPAPAPPPQPAQPPQHVPSTSAETTYRASPSVRDDSIFMRPKEAEQKPEPLPQSTPSTVSLPYSEEPSQSNPFLREQHSAVDDSPRERNPFL